MLQKKDGFHVDDPDIVGKLRAYVEKGGIAVITSGFLREAGDALRQAGLTEAKMTGRSFMATRYHVTGDRAGYIDHVAPILFPELVHANNDSWSLLNGGDSDVHSTLLLRRAYGKGRLYILAVPELDADLYTMPKAATDVLKRVLTGGEYVSGRNFSAFVYDDGSMILYRYVKEDLRPDTVTLRTRRKVRALVDIAGGREIPVREERLWEDFTPAAEYAADVVLMPGQFIKLRWE